MSTQTNELDNTGPGPIGGTTGRVRECCTDFGASAGANSGRCNPAFAGEPDKPSEPRGTPGTSAAGSNPDNAASVQAQTVVTSPVLTTPAQPSNAGGTGLQPGYMNMNQHPTIPPQGFKSSTIHKSYHVGCLPSTLGSSLSGHAMSGTNAPGNMYTSSFYPDKP